MATRTMLGEVARSRANNFDVLRLFAAALVLVSHSFSLTGRHDPLGRHSLGEVGVEIFFAVSGFLVTKSWLSDPGLRSFLRKRALRIFPGLACAVAVTTLVIGPLFSDRSVLSYFGSAGTWAYLVENASLHPGYLLPGVFAGNPDAAVNGSLWTLPVEVRAYVALGLLGLAGLLRSRLIGVVALVTVVANVAVVQSPSMRIASLFVGGSALYILRDRIVLRADVAAFLFALWAVALETRFETAVAMMSVPYLVAWAAYRSPRKLHRLVSAGDVSYGMYVYAFPLQQSIVALIGPSSPFLLIAIALPTVWLVGLASWRLVERPILRRKQRSIGADGVVPMPAVTASG